MRYAFVSDIHSNLQAWKVVREDIRNNSIDRVICLGDVIGYGPNPAEILRALRGTVDAFVLGNHDAAVCGKLDPELFNDDARLVLEWTKKQLSDEDIRFLGSAPLTLIGDGFLCAHGEFAAPGNFDYVLEAAEALPSWKANDASLMFVGHTHEPALYVLGASGIPRTVDPQDFVVDAGKRYFVNIGSVGQPRGDDPRSCYCIYDTGTKAVYWRRLAFDVEPYRNALKATGLKLDPSYYLMPEPKKAEGVPPKRRIVFTPPKSPEKAARDVVASQDLKNLPPPRKPIPKNLVSATLIALVVIGMGIWKWAPFAVDLDATSGTLITATSAGILHEVGEVVKPREPIPGWNLHLDNRNRQRAGVGQDKLGKSFTYLVSESEKYTARLASGWAAAKPGQEWDVDASFQTQKGFSGAITLAVAMAPAGKEPPVQARDLFTRSIVSASGGKWVRIRERITVPANTGRLQFQIRGKFSGTVAIREMNLASLAQARPAAEEGLVEPAPAAMATPEPEQEQPAPAVAEPVAAPQEPAAAPQEPAATPEAAPAPAPAVDPWKQKVE